MKDEEYVTNLQHFSVNKIGKAKAIQKLAIFDLLIIIAYLTDEIEILGFLCTVIINVLVFYSLLKNEMLN